MGTLTIYFAGICSHLWQAKPEPGVPHRTVLVNAREGFPARNIEPHWPEMRVVSGEIVSGTVPELRGVTITVRDRVATCDYRPSYRTCIPHLQSYTDEDVVIDHDVTRDRNAARTAAYVDIHGGRWRARADQGGAAVAYVTIQTDTPDVALSIEPFLGVGPADLVIRDNSIIQIENIGRSLTDNDQDFLLHFLVTGRIPDNARWPVQGDLTCKPFEPPLKWNRGTIGPGCSNSNYP